MFGKKKEKETGEDADQIEEEVSAKKEEGPPEVGEMRRGDYMIHVFIEKAKEMKCPQDSTIDPLFEITCLGQKQYSSAKDDISNVSEVTWSEHLFLEPHNVGKKEAEDAKICIKLMDKGFMKNALVGQYEFDLSFIYFRESHLYLHKWIALSNPNGDNYSEITGYLKLSISVACTGDEQIQINEDDAIGGDDVVEMPPQIQPKFYQVKIRFFCA
jgi:hypothetical protein